MDPEELDKLTDEELWQIVLRGENLHRPNSRASIAIRILDARAHKPSKFSWLNKK